MKTPDPDAPGWDARAGHAGPRVPGATHLHRELRERILALELCPGEELDESALAERFGCSRTAVREALLNLSADRLVELLPNRGARVVQLDLIELPRFVETVDLVARAVNWYAAERRSEAQLAEIVRTRQRFEALVEAADPTELTAGQRVFHMAVAEAADNRHLHEIYRRLHDEGMRIMHLALGRARSGPDSQREHLARVCEEHGELIAAIEARDRPRAEAMARAHTESFRRRLFAYLQSDAGDAVGIRPLTE